MPRRDQILLQGIRLPDPNAPGASRRAAAPLGRPREVNLRLWLDLGEAAFRDRIDCTVDYREVHRRVLSIAARRAPDLAGTLSRELLTAFPAVQAVEVDEAGGSVTRRRPSARAPSARGNE